MEYPRITLITPSFNQGAFLEQTITSVLKQQYPNLEYFVIDGGSTDDSVKVMEKYRSQLSWCVSEKDGGQTHAINKGLVRATGEIVSWLNSDDYLHPGALHKIAERFSDPAVSCVIGRIEYFNSKGPVRRSGSVVKHPAEKTLGSAVVPQPAMYFRKSCYDEIGLLNEKLSLWFDNEWYMRYIIRYGIEGIREIAALLVHFRFHDVSKSVSLGEEFNLERAAVFNSLARKAGDKRVPELLCELYSFDDSFEFDVPENPPGISYSKALNYFLLMLGVEFYYRSEFKTASRCFSLVDRKLLDPASYAYCRRISMRNNLVPGWLIRKMRRKPQ